MAKNAKDTDKGIIDKNVNQQDVNDKPARLKKRPSPPQPEAKARPQPKKKLRSPPQGRVPAPGPAAEDEEESPADSDLERSIETFLENSCIEAVPQYIKLDSKSLQNYKYIVGKLGSARAAYYIAKSMEDLAIDIHKAMPDHPSWFNKSSFHPPPAEIGFAEINTVSMQPVATGYWVLQRKPAHLRRPMSYTEAAEKFAAAASSSSPAAVEPTPLTPTAGPCRAPVWVEFGSRPPRRPLPQPRHPPKQQHDKATQVIEDELKNELQRIRPKSEVAETATVKPELPSGVDAGDDADAERERDDVAAKKHDKKTKKQKKKDKNEHRLRKDAEKAAQEAEYQAEDERAAAASPSPTKATVATSDLDVSGVSIDADVASDDPYMGKDVSDIIPVIPKSPSDSDTDTGSNP
jgi:hypothetical protein